MARNCKVVTTCFVGREIRKTTTRCGDPPGPYRHAQVFPDAESVLELMSLVHEFELKVDPGAPCDTVIVNNDVGWDEGNRYLASLHGSRTFAGNITVLNRENYGASLGGYDFAYQRLKHRYDVWAFTEDDILITGDRYLARSIEVLQSDRQVGFVALQALSRDPALHAHGGVGATRVDVLDAVDRLWGYLPHRLRDESQAWDDHSIWGEVLFTHLMHRLGYRLTTLPSTAPHHAFAYEVMRARGQGRRAARRKLLPRALRTLARGAGRWAASLD